MTPLPIVVPAGFSSIIQIGDQVIVGQPLAQKYTSDEHIINIAEEFSVSVLRAKKTLKKNPGESITIGEVLAVKKGLLGFGEEAIVSQVAGTITRFERDTGNLAIRTSYNSLTQNIISPVDGVIALCDNGKIIIHTDKNVITGRKASGDNTEGEIFILEASLTQSEDIREENISYFLDSRAIGKIVVGGILTRDLLAKGIGMGCLGMIGTRIEDIDLAYIVEKKIKNPIIEIEEEILGNLLQWKGKRIFIDSPSKSIVFLHV